MNWTGHVVAAPRSDLPALLKRPESNRTGVYFLFGDDPNSLGGQTAYIGEGDDISKRLRQHARPEAQGGKDFWDRAIVLTSKDANLTKAHARYLESRFITLAQLSKRARLTNGTAPPPIVLPEADVSDMEYFISQAKIVLPVLGVNLLRSAVTATESNRPTAVISESVIAPPDSPVFELRLKKDGITAKAREIDAEFTVLEGSQVRGGWVGSSHEGYKVLRDKLIHDGVIFLGDGGIARFTQDQVFSSPSAAAVVIVGRSANGRNDWKVPETGLSYGDWQSQGIEDAALLDEP
ncbi:GIY-YIG nuclease family protein [Rhodococcus sp. 06-1474-1B]|uniref:GIY-YIG nuclease family protein n=1 Tax=Rhodococcus sp. 06-1474-1B TaxID=2022499 RepID=UPI0020CEE64E|nr:GIY-YIG nuclease family protein [Rhodococcus sp. 06-1474-1B]